MAYNRFYVTKESDEHLGETRISNLFSFMYLLHKIGLTTPFIVSGHYDGSFFVTYDNSQITKIISQKV